MSKREGVRGLRSAAGFEPSVVCPRGFQYNMRMMSMTENIHSRMNGLGHWVGNTPLLAINFKFDGDPGLTPCPRRTA